MSPSHNLFIILISLCISALLKPLLNLFIDKKSKLWLRATSTPPRTVPRGTYFAAISILRFFTLRTWNPTLTRASGSIISASVVFVILTPSPVKCQSSLRNISNTSCFAYWFLCVLVKPRLKKSKMSRVRWVCCVNVLLLYSSSRRKWRVVHVWPSMLRTFLFFSPIQVWSEDVPVFFCSFFSKDVKFRVT